MKKFVFLIFLFALKICFAQTNLVPNPGFEEHSSCPNDMWQISLANHWQNATLCLSEYFNSCGTNWVSVPSNASGFEFAHNGLAYAGVYGFYNTVNYGQGYIQTQLIDTLKSNIKYYIEFFISLADSLSLATTHMGAFLSDSSIFVSTYNTLPLTPQIISSTIEQVTTKNGWSKISGYFTAHGGEKYITIGNFNPDTIADTVFVSQAHWYPGAYYYIDDVFVGTDTTVSVAENQKELSYFNVYPNPSKEKLFVEYRFADLKNEKHTIDLFTIDGKLMQTLTVNKNMGTVTLDVKDLPSGNYFISLGSKTLNKKVTIIH